MKKYVYQLDGFNEIYKNPKKIELKSKLNEIEKKIEILFYNKNLSMDLCALTLHESIYIIEKENVSLKELEKIVYSLSYYFLKDYIDIKKLVELSKMSEKELENESKKSLELLKSSYKLVENKDLKVDSIFERMKKFVDWKNEKN